MRFTGLMLGWLIGGLGLAAACPGAGGPVGPEPKAAGTSGVSQTPLPRAILLADPDRAEPKLSPDGQWVSFLSEFEGAINVWVAPVDHPDQARVVTRQAQDVYRYNWAHTSEHILFLLDEPDLASWRIMCTDLRTNACLDLTPFKGAQPKVVALSPDRPREALVQVNNRAPELRDLYVVSLDDASMRLVRAAPPGVVGWVVDRQWEVRFGVSFDETGSQRLIDPQTMGEALTFGPEDSVTSGAIGFHQDGVTLFAKDSRGRDTGALVAIDCRTMTARPVAADARADLEEVIRDPRTGEVDAASFRYLKREWVVLNPALKDDFEALAALGDGEIEILSRSNDDSRWLVGVVDDDGPDWFYLYTPADRRARRLFSSSDALAGLKLAPMRDVVIPARDGRTMTGYLTLPPDRTDAGAAAPRSPAPMVMLIHGGPWARDQWSYNGVHQLLADRGYAVLSVNFRGSTGFGKDFVNAGDREWGKAMQDDLVDAAHWAIAKRVTTAGSIGLMGSSYGGFAAISALIDHPELFACGVTASAPVDLNTLMQSIPAYWRPLVSLFKQRVGDWTTPEGQAMLRKCSPVHRCEALRRPLLAAHGKDDPRVRLEETRQVVRAAQSQGGEGVLVVFDHEGHGLVRTENIIAFYALAEEFLARHLGGRAEPPGQALGRSSGTVVGAGR